MTGLCQHADAVLKRWDHEEDTRWTLGYLQDRALRRAEGRLLSSTSFSNTTDSADTEMPDRAETSKSRLGALEGSPVLSVTCCCQRLHLIPPSRHRRQRGRIPFTCMDSSAVLQVLRQYQQYLTTMKLIYLEKCHSVVCGRREDECKKYLSFRRQSEEDSNLFASRFKIKILPTLSTQTNKHWHTTNDISRNVKAICSKEEEGEIKGRTFSTFQTRQSQSSGMVSRPGLLRLRLSVYCITSRPLITLQSAAEGVWSLRRKYLLKVFG